jgi:hypothetical protein
MITAKPCLSLSGPTQPSKSQAASGQDAEAKAHTQAIIAMLEDKRTEVMRREQAGYFIHDWQEITSQVRQLIFHDARYAAIRARQVRS